MRFRPGPRSESLGTVEKPLPLESLPSLILSVLVKDGIGWNRLEETRKSLKTLLGRRVSGFRAGHFYTVYGTLLHGLRDTFTRFGLFVRL